MAYLLQAPFNYFVDTIAASKLLLALAANAAIMIAPIFAPIKRPKRKGFIKSPSCKNGDGCRPPFVICNFVAYHLYRLAPLRL